MQTVGILIGIVLISIVYLLMRKPSKEEGFQNPQYTTKSLEINMCPTFATEIQTAKGNTDCCQGDMVDGKCNGKTFCTKSPAYPGVSNCVDAWRKHFEKKGVELCPATMRNYYEDVSNPRGVKGCSAGPISKDGKQPTNRSMKQCRIYASEADNRNKRDSCFLEKERIKVQCPVVNRNSPPAEAYFEKDKFELFMCKYPFELGMPDFCVERKTATTYFNQKMPNWRTNKDRVKEVEEIFCENYIRRREQARVQANRLQQEQRRREQAEAARKKAEDDARKRAQQASRLQQQLDEANRRLQNCKR
jgi:hypothetical protein